MNATHILVPAVTAIVLIGAAGQAQSPPTADLFDPQTLQEIRLSVNSRDLRSLHERYLENTYYTADFQWRNLRVRNVGIRSRGVASRSATKPALRVDFDRYTTGQTFLGLKSLILKNLWQDGSMMHEHLAMGLFARLGQAASRQSFCRLYVNNEYYGLYTIVESVDREFLQRTSGESDGYLFSFQLTEPYYGGDLGDNLAEYRLRLEPQTHELASDAELYLPVRELLREVNQPDDAVWRERVEAYVDLGQFVTQAAIENYLAEDDGLLGVTGMNNFYLYRPGGTSRHRFIPWDKDGAFLLPGHSIVQRVEENILFRRAFGHDDLRQLYMQVLEAAAQSASSDNWMEAEIVRIAALVAASVEEDSRKPFSTAAFYESVEIMRQFARQRPGIVRDQIAQFRVAR
jgi:spore coat protein CotH